MLKLIRKDFMAFYYIIIFQSLFIILLMTFGLFIDHKGTLTIVGLIMYPMVLPTVLLVSDIKYQSLSNGLPVSRNMYVISKYVFGFGASFVLLIVGLSYGYIVTTYIVTDGIEMIPIFTIQGLFFLSIPVLVLNGLTYPIFFRFCKKNASIILMVIFAVLMIGFILGLVYFETTWMPAMNYSESEVFPVVIDKLTTYVTSISKELFLLQMSLFTVGYITLSLALSVYVFSRKDIGG